MNVAALTHILVEKLGENLPAPEPELRFHCPKCPLKKKSEDRSGHLHVNADVEKFVCFRCGWKGPLVALLNFLNVSVEAQIRDWAEIARGMSIFSETKPEEIPYDNTEELEYPCPVAHPLMVPAAWNYLTNPKDEGGRGLTMEQINHYQIAAALDGHILPGPNEKYKGRIFVPTLHDGKVVFWVARSYTRREPKYLNPEDVKKKHYIFGLDQVKKIGCQWVIITEGVFSAIAAGVNAVATFGKEVSLEQRVMLMDAGFQRYYIALDADARKEAIELCQWLKARGIDVYLVDMPSNQDRKLDPDSDPDFMNRINSAKPFSFYSTAAFGLGSV